MGNSSGRWEGETLVVSTRGLSSKANFMGSTAGQTLEERFTRISCDTLQYDATLTDPATWARPLSRSGYRASGCSWNTLTGVHGPVPLFEYT